MNSLILCLLAIPALGTFLEPRQVSNRAVVDVAVNRGKPQQLASGVLYGMPDAEIGRPQPIPDVFYQEPKLKYFRAGGAQMFNVGQRGWHFGEYEARFRSTLENYRTARKYGGEFQMLPHDIWGTDTVNGSTVWPGDNGDWTDYDAFLTRLMADMKKNNMIRGVKWDIWNEPDNDIFWKRPRSQWLDLWGRTYYRVRGERAFSNVPMIGPSHAGYPLASNPWWSEFMSFVAKNGSSPQQYTFHVLFDSNDEGNTIDSSNVQLDQMIASSGAVRGTDVYCCNEYINAGDERVCSANAWFIAGLERNQNSGLRANWLSTGELHDFLAELVYRPNAQSAYQPNGQYQLYKYYAQSMTGTRAGTTRSADGKIDVFATYERSVIKVLTGVRSRVGTWEVEVRNLQSHGWPVNGTVNILTYGFDDPGLRAVVNGPSNRGVFSHSYTDGVLRFPVFQTPQELKTAWAFEIRRP